MSTAWAGGSTRRWRAIRAFVLDRDGWVCGLCHRTIDPTLRHPHPMSAQVHHPHGKAKGDDPALCMAAHRLCNLRAGDPTTTSDPHHRPMTRW